VLYLSSVAKAKNDDEHPRRPVGLEVVNETAAETDEQPAGWMNPVFVDAIARRVLELGSDRAVGRAASECALLTVAEVAARLNVSQSWVYAHKRDIGAIRLGTGPKARLRFDATAVRLALNRRETSVRSGTNGPIEAPKRTRRRLVSRPIPRSSRAA
jgi:hypothetical protein